MVEHELLLLVVGGGGVDDLVGDDVGAGEAEEAGAADGAALASSRRRSCRPGVEITRKMMLPVINDDEQGPEHAGDHVRRGLGEVGEDGQRDDDEHEAVRAGLAHGADIEEAEFLEHDAVDEREDQSADGEGTAGVGDHAVDPVGGDGGEEADKGDLGHDDVGAVVLVGQGRDETLLGDGVGRGYLGGDALELLAGLDEAADTLGLALQAEGADGVADEALHDHDEGGKDAELDAVIGNGILHGEGGDNARRRGWARRR